MKTSARWKRPDAAWRTAAGLALAAALLLGAGGVAFAQDEASDPAARKQQIIRDLVALTDAEQMEAIFSRQFIDRVANAVALFRPGMDPATMRVVREESTAVIRERIESGDALYSVLYPVYARHFDIVELSQLLDFYQSPLGQKLIQVSPQLLTESLSLGREWGLSLVPEIANRVQARLAEQK